MLKLGIVRLVEMRRRATTVPIGILCRVGHNALKTYFALRYLETFPSGIVQVNSSPEIETVATNGPAKAARPPSSTFILSLSTNL